ncbi:PIN domain-containing protein [Halorussus salinus]|uniref:PIN domain-containing protein n=1 Tax=Halorussus salinus TaxID=1364935 RepID=UPI001092851C|nr:PIN domain-containing protein [Halorussus salinus]
MIYLDSSVLADYLRGRQYVGEYVQKHDSTKFHTSSIIMWELFYGALNHDSSSRTMETVAESLSWLEVVPFTFEDAAEAASVRDELYSNGTPIQVPDMLLAGTARQAGGTVVTCDKDFEQVPNLSVELLAPEK